MYRYKTSKQAIFISVLAILLCLVSLSGATFALFTSDVGDGRIGVITTAGNIDVDIIDVETGESLVNGTLDFYDGIAALFEPGARFCTEGFKIKNTGDIPINFKVYVSEDKSIDMTAFNRAFDAWLITDPTNPDEGTRLTEFTGSLAVTGQTSECTYYLVIKMKEDAGNQFSGQIYTGIGVTVYAVQGNVEI